MSGSRRITELTSATVLNGSEVFPIVQDGETRQVNVRALDVFQLVRSVNGVDGEVILTLNDIGGVEPIVQTGGVSAAIALVSTAVVSVQAYTLTQISVAAAQTSAAAAALSYADLALACSDEISPVVTGTAIQFTFPRAMTLQSLVFECNAVPVSTTCELEVRVSGSVLHSGYVQIDPGTATSRSAVVPTSLVKTNIAQWRRGFVSVRTTDAAMTGLKLYLLGLAVPG